MKKWQNKKHHKNRIVAVTMRGQLCVIVAEHHVLQNFDVVKTDCRKSTKHILLTEGIKNVIKL
jgi:hypothetical protein